MKVLAIVQARMNSSRLPHKVMKEVEGTPLIELLLRRLACAKEVDQIVVAVPSSEGNAPLVSHVRRLGFSCELGSENDVLSRYIQAAERYHADVVVRITGDCPLVDPDLVDKAIRCFKGADVDYLSNSYPPSYPDGLDIEVFSFDALRQAGLETAIQFDREHVTPYLRKPGRFKTQNICNEKEDLSAFRWTIDEEVDFQVIKEVFTYFSPRIDFSWTEVLRLQFDQPKLFLANQHVVRNEGSVTGTGPKLWRRAKKVIPGGSMLLSKRAEMFLPERWPAYFSKSKGCRVWDLDEKKYIDMSIMGIGTNSLGYGNQSVDDAVKRTISNGNMSTLNCPEEVYLAEKLIELHEWADMVRFTRSGGEANAIAVRIARAATGKDKVAICGYHGWHDWYLAANLGETESLDGHLLPGLQANGVPRGLKDTVYTFSYNDYSALEALVNQHDIGVIKMEVMRNQYPIDNFLQKVRSLATKKGIVLIFDECTSGFRETFGGLHKKYGVEPDIAMFGKTLGNGYAIAAVVGRRSVMEAAQSTFISSTFWTERIGPTAALATLKAMEDMKSWEIITNIGKKIKNGWQKLADSHNLSITQWGLPALAGFTFNSRNALAYKTLITQEMLAKGYLAGTSVYACVEHTDVIIDEFFINLDPIFGLIRDCESGRDVMTLLTGPIAHDGFKRLN